jgi:hypothetical protein
MLKGVDQMAVGFKQQLTNLSSACDRRYLTLVMTKIISPTSATLVPQTMIDQGRDVWDITNPIWRQVGDIAQVFGIYWGGQAVDSNNGTGTPTPSYFAASSKEKKS